MFLDIVNHTMSLLSNLCTVINGEISILIKRVKPPDLYLETDVRLRKLGSLVFAHCQHHKVYFPRDAKR